MYMPIPAETLAAPPTPDAASIQPLVTCAVAWKMQSEPVASVLTVTVISSALLPEPSPRCQISPAVAKNGELAKAQSVPKVAGVAGIPDIRCACLAVCQFSIRGLRAAVEHGQGRDARNGENSAAGSAGGRAHAAGVELVALQPTPPLDLIL
jgi:hypothetical protein